MDGRAITLGVVAGLAAAGLARKRAMGSRDARTPTDTTGLVVGETKFGTPAVVLVDLSRLEGVQTLSDLKAQKDAVLAFIAMDYPKDYAEHPTSACDDANGSSPLQVSMSVAQKGWGPLAYDAALWVAADNAVGSEAYNGYLMPDRNNVFPGARKVWTYYATHRKADVTSRKLRPRCPRHGYPDDDPILDRMYRAKANRPAFQRMSPMYERWASVREDLEDRLGMDREEIEGVLVRLGETFFGEKM